MKIAIYYHAKLIGPEFGIDTEFALNLFHKQIALLERTGLMQAASHISIGLNEQPPIHGRLNATIQKLPIMFHGSNARSEIPTLHALQRWLPKDEEWYVLYFHAKGVTHPNDRLCNVWRACMTRAVINNWHRCIKDLDAGADTVGAHWLTREQFGPMVGSFFWGGNFWWARSSFLRKLPQLPKTSVNRDMDFIAEKWIGMGPRPKVVDYAPHWPGLLPCSADSYMFTSPRS